MSIRDPQKESGKGAKAGTEGVVAVLKGLYNATLSLFRGKSDQTSAPESTKPTSLNLSVFQQGPQQDQNVEPPKTLDPSSSSDPPSTTSSPVFTPQRSDVTAREPSAKLGDPTIKLDIKSNMDKLVEEIHKINAQPDPHKPPRPE